MTSWNDERCDRLRKLWADGYSCSQIAADLWGVSRNGVIGKVHRLGLSGRVKQTSSLRPQRDPRERALKRAIKKAAALASSSEKAAIETEAEQTRQRLFEEAEARCNALGRPLIHLDELTSTTCRWPIGNPGEADFGFCGGEPVGVYCAYHHRVGTQPATAPRRPYRGD